MLFVVVSKYDDFVFYGIMFSKNFYVKFLEVGIEKFVINII